MSQPKPGNPHSVQPIQIVEETSAGGVVVRVENGIAETAIISRYNRAGKLEWCLPKGHPEGDENNEQAAVREIAEETGILGKIVANLGHIDYWFSAEGHRIHKVVHHYLLRAVGGTLTIENDPDHEAVDVKWCRLESIDSWLAFENERHIARLALKEFKRRAVTDFNTA